MIYFGTRDFMKWVKAPAVDTPLSGVGWSNSGTDLNGGGFAKLSPTAHREYEFTWGASPAKDIYDILDYRTGAYGDGLLYYVDPFAMRSNVLPSSFSIPRVLCESGLMGGTHVGVTGTKTIATNLETNPRFVTATGIPVGMTRAQQPDGTWHLVNPPRATSGYGHSPYGHSEYGN